MNNAITIFSDFSPLRHVNLGRFLIFICVVDSVPFNLYIILTKSILFTKNERKNKKGKKNTTVKRNEFLLTKRDTDR